MSNPLLKSDLKQDIIASLKINGEDFSVYKFHGDSEVNELYSLDITFISEQKLDISDLVDRDIELSLNDVHTDENKFFCGKVYKASEDSVVANIYMYNLQVSSPLRYLSLNKRYEIFHDKKANEIIEEILARHAALLNIKLEVKLDTSTIPVREYTTQYAQSDLHFIDMLCQEEGFSLIYDYSSSKEYKLILCRLNEHAKSIKYKVTGDYNFKKEFSPTQNLHSYYDEDRPSLAVQNKTGSDLKSAIKDNSATKQLKMDLVRQTQKNLLNKHEGDLGKDLIRYSELDALRQFVVSSEFYGNTAELFMSDSIFVELHDEKSDKTDEAIIISAHYEGMFPNALREYVQEDENSVVPQYSVSYRAIPKDVIYVPQIKEGYKPKISSTQTAIVSQGSPDAKDAANEIDVDEKGRIRVLFHFEENQATSCYLRVANFFAGNGYGSQFIPRVNSEVLVSFIDGDIDKPIIIGALHNGENKNPYDLPASKTRSHIKTHSIPAHDGEFGYNEIAFEDKNDAEVLSLRAQKDYALHAQNNSYKNIDNDQKEVVANNDDTTIGGNQTQLVKQSKAETIIIAKALTVGAAYQVTVGAAKNETVGLSSSEQVGITKHTVVGKRFELSVGSSSLILNEDGTIILSGNKISIEGSDSIVANAKMVEIN